MPDLRIPGRSLVGLLALLVAAPVCTTEEECDPSAKRTCDGFHLQYCGEDRKPSKYNCATDGKTCRLDKDGEGHCSADCPPGLDADGRCLGTVLQRCEGDFFRDYDCAKDGEFCGYSAGGTAYCTNACPTGLAPGGECDGTRVRRCDGGSFIDYDCAQDGQTCGKDADGVAWCTSPCPKGLDYFGVCEGAVVRRCEGEVFFEYDCGTIGATCGQVNRHGVGCIGCGDATPEGTCSKTGTATWCSFNDRQSDESCTAQGVACGFDEALCRYACLDVPPTPCSAGGLADGEARCKTNPVTKFASIVSCKDGVLVTEECAAASDGSVTCEEELGAANCKPTCGPSGKACTDRGVLVDCSTANAWTDCAAYGATCATDPEPHCACTALAESTARCVRGKRAICSDGKLEFEACTCTPP